MGLNFVYRMAEETGATADEVAICYVMAREIFDLSNYWHRVTGLNNQIPTIVQTEMLYQIRRNIRRATRWFLRHRNKSLNIEQTIAYFKPTFEDLVNNLDKYLVEEESASLSNERQALVDEGVPADIANYVASLSTLFSLMDIAEIADQTAKPLNLVSQMYFTLGASLDLHWFLDQITNQPVSNHWQALARASYREELDWQQRALTTNVLKYCDTECPVSDILQSWKDDNSQLLGRWQMMLAEFKSSNTHEFAKFSVALRELMLLGKNNEQGA
jgi:glutamate dehydrogenase